MTQEEIDARNERFAFGLKMFTIGVLAGVYISLIARWLLF